MSSQITTAKYLYASEIRKAQMLVCLDDELRLQADFAIARYKATSTPVDLTKMRHAVATKRLNTSRLRLSLAKAKYFQDLVIKARLAKAAELKAAANAQRTAADSAERRASLKHNLLVSILLVTYFPGVFSWVSVWKTVDTYVNGSVVQKVNN